MASTQTVLKNEVFTPMISAGRLRLLAGIASEK